MVAREAVDEGADLLGGVLAANCLGDQVALEVEQGVDGGVHRAHVDVGDGGELLSDMALGASP